MKRFFLILVVFVSSCSSLLALPSELPSLDSSFTTHSPETFPIFGAFAIIIIIGACIAGLMLWSLWRHLRKRDASPA